MSPVDSRHEGEDEALQRLIRTWKGDREVSLSALEEEALTAYVMGIASPPQIAGIQAILIQSPEFRRQLLELMQISSGAFSEEQRVAFERATPPAISQDRDLSRLASELAPDSAPPKREGLAERRRRPGWVDWLVSGWAVTATVAAGALLVMVLRPPGPSENQPELTIGDKHPALVDAPVAPATPVPTGHPLVVLGVLETITLRGPSRGTPSVASPVFKIRALTKAIELRLEPPDVPHRSLVRVTVTGPGGTPLVQAVLPVEDVSRDRGLVILAREDFRPGPYVVTVVGHRDTILEQVRYTFSILVGEH